jgi:FixJ family two-component response regulator
MDDEPVVLETFGKMFHLLGFEVLKFSEGQAVLDFLKLQPAAFPGITAAMLDLTIRGGMGGKEVATEIRKLSSTLPIFVSSGYADDPIMESPQNYGINGSICKPFRIGELSALLQKNL